MFFIGYFKGEITIHICPVCLYSSAIRIHLPQQLLLDWLIVGIRYFTLHSYGCGACALPVIHDTATRQKQNIRGRKYFFIISIE